ncbi:MAG: hypothetical protein EA369_01040, partial [Bradymonadales bacterium]
RADEVFTKTEVLPTGKFSQSEQNENLGWSAVTSKTSNGKELLVSYVSGELIFFEADGNGGLLNRQVLSVGTSVVFAPEFHDLTGDGKDELVLLDSTGLRIFSVGSAGLWTETQHISGARDYDLGDINGDGSLDLAIRTNLDEARTYLNDGSGGFELLETFAGAIASFSGSTRGHSIALADLNANGRADLVYMRIVDPFSQVGGPGMITTQLSQADGTMTFGADTYISVDSLTFEKSGDLNANGRIDFRAWDWGADTAVRLMSNGDGTFTSEAFFGPTDSGFYADLSGNGAMDFVSTNGQIWLNDGTGAMSSSQNFSSQLGELARRNPLIADLNGNGHLDLAFQSTFDAQLTVLLNDGEGSFKISQTFDLGAGSLPAFGVLGMDLNGDGLKDIIAPGSGESLFLMGSFEREVAETDIRIDSQERAQEMLALFDTALSNLLDRLALIGATTSRLESARESILITTENLESARSQIRDADIAEETANLVRMQILQQAGVSVLGQANLSPQLALQLLNT